MPSLPPNLYTQCRNTLLKCSEFDTNAALQAVFATDELHPFRSGLPEAVSKSRRVDANLDYLLSQRLSDGRPLFPLFLAALTDRYPESDALHGELEALKTAFLNLPPTSGTYTMSRRRGFLAELGKLRLALLLLALLVVSVACSLLCAWGVTFLTRDDRRIYSARVEDQDENTIVAYNQKGDPIWQVELDSRVREVILDDINQDGRQEVTAATHEPGERPGWLLVFDETGDLVAEYNTWRPTIYRGAASDQFNVTDFLIVDLTGDGTKEIVVVSQDVYWYASRLAVLRFRDGKLRDVSEYWNPGLLNTLAAADVNGDGIQEIVCTGENNDLQAIYPIEGNASVVFAFEGTKISGQAPPSFGDAPKGTELWYAYAPPPTSRVTEVGFVDVDGDGVTEFHVALTANCSWYLDSQGNVVRRGIGTGCTDEVELIVLQTGK